MDNFSDFPTTLSAPARDAAAIVPNDSINLAAMPRAIYVGQGGNVSAVMAGGQVIAFQNVPSGAMLPVRVSRVNATGTTAGALIALW